MKLPACKSKSRPSLAYKHGANKSILILLSINLQSNAIYYSWIKLITNTGKVLKKKKVMALCKQCITVTF